MSELVFVIGQHVGKRTSELTEAGKRVFPECYEDAMPSPPPLFPHSTSSDGTAEEQTQPQAAEAEKSATEETQQPAAEAKSTAEPSNQQEAEAKSTAEPSNQQEAEAKSAAEPSQQQKAEAKSAAEPSQQPAAAAAETSSEAQATRSTAPTYDRWTQGRRWMRFVIKFCAAEKFYMDFLNLPQTDMMNFHALLQLLRLCLLFLSDAEDLLDDLTEGLDAEQKDDEAVRDLFSFARRYTVALRGHAQNNVRKCSEIIRRESTQNLPEALE